MIDRQRQQHNMARRRGSGGGSVWSALAAALLLISAAGVLHASGAELEGFDDVASADDHGHHHHAASATTRAAATAAASSGVLDGEDDDEDGADAGGSAASSGPSYTLNQGAAGAGRPRGAGVPPPSNAQFSSSPRGGRPGSTAWSDNYRFEIGAALFLVAYLVNLLIGRSHNHSIAGAWAKHYAAPGGVFDRNFAQLGPSGQEDADVLMKDSASCFKLYASGRR